MKSVLFMLGKDPFGPSMGDVVMSRLVMDLARSSYSVRAVALSNAAPGQRSGDDLHYLPKPRVSIPSLAARSILRNRSLIHTRFDTAELRNYVAAATDDRFVAEHSYMAESFIRTRPLDAPSKLVVNTHVPEALVLRGTRSMAAIPEVQRTARDERRVAMGARSVGAFDGDEARTFRANGARRSIYLSLTLPPGPPVNFESSSGSLVFVGDLSWAPNRSALSAVTKVWPSIRALVPNAELRLIGKGTAEYAAISEPGIVGLGYVPDLQAELLQARALIAPITVGGGVRVKLLEAISIGLPIIGSRSAIGTLDSFLPIEVSDTPQELVDRAVRLLLDPSYAAAEGRGLYEANHELWSEGKHEQLVANWIE